MPRNPLTGWLVDTFGLRIGALVTGVADAVLFVGSTWLDKLVKMLLPHEHGWGSTAMEFITTLAIVGTVLVLAVHDLWQLAVRLFRNHDDDRKGDDDDDDE